MGRAHGYLMIVDPGAPITERDTCACRHCQRIIEIKPGSAATVFLIPDAQGNYKEEPGAFCRCCMGPVCLPCEAKGTCTPFEKQLEQAEARFRFHRSIGLA
jgi:hypothetical protein